MFSVSYIRLGKLVFFFFSSRFWLNIKGSERWRQPSESIRGFITGAWKCKKELGVKAPAATFLVNGLIRIMTCNLLIRPRSVLGRDVFLLGLTVSEDPLWGSSLSAWRGAQGNHWAFLGTFVTNAIHVCSRLMYPNSNEKLDGVPHGLLAECGLCVCVMVYVFETHIWPQCHGLSYTDKNLYFSGACVSINTPVLCIWKLRSGSLDALGFRP